MKGATVELTLTGEQPGKPPLVQLQVDVLLRNDSAEPRWFLLPSNLPPTRGGVDVLEVFTLVGQGRAVVGRFLGTGGFQALLVPAKAQIKVHKMPLSYWQDPPPSLSVEVTIARELTVGGEPAQSWFTTDPTSDTHAEVSYDHSKMSHIKRTPDLREVQASWVEDQRIAAELVISPRR